MKSAGRRRGRKTGTRSVPASFRWADKGGSSWGRKQSLLARLGDADRQRLRVGNLDLVANLHAFQVLRVLNLDGQLLSVPGRDGDRRHRRVDGGDRDHRRVLLRDG